MHRQSADRAELNGAMHIGKQKTLYTGMFLHTAFLYIQFLKQGQYKRFIRPFHYLWKKAVHLQSDFRSLLIRNYPRWKFLLYPAG